jgi:hypothetical protein
MRHGPNYDTLHIYAVSAFLFTVIARYSCAIILSSHLKCSLSFRCLDSICSIALPTHS